MKYTKDNIIGLKFKTGLRGETVYKIVGYSNYSNNLETEWYENGQRKTSTAYGDKAAIHYLNAGTWIAVE
jgi:hypothetical protein